MSADADSGREQSSAPDVTRSTRPTRNVVLIGLLSAALYALTYYLTRGIFYNGFHTDFLGSSTEGHERNGALLVAQVLGYALTTAGSFVLYALLLRLCMNAELASKTSRALAVAFPVAFYLALLFGRPYQSTDAFSYAVHGYYGNLPGKNPYTTANRCGADTILAQQLAGSGWRPTHGPSPYGPLWSRVEMAASGMTLHLPATVFLTKAVVVASSFGVAALIWLILGRIAPNRRMLGLLAYLWNPLLIYEYASEGHNDALMVVFAMGAILLCVTKRPALAVVATVLGVLTKFLSALAVPAQTAYFWHTATDRKRTVLRAFAGLGIGVVVTILLYGNLWSGIHTFAGLQGAGSANRSCTLAGGAYAALSFVIGLPVAGTIVAGAARLTFLYVILRMAWRVRDERAMVEAIAVAVLWYTLLVSMRYFPWYACFGASLMALSPSRRFLVGIMVVSFFARLGAPVCAITDNGFMAWLYGEQIQTAVCSALPATILCGAWLWQRRQWKAETAQAVAPSSLSGGQAEPGR